MKADDLKQMAALWLRARFPTAHIAFEFSVAHYGTALVDVAAVTPEQIVGVEIKGEGDTVSRLKLQGEMYPRVCRTMFLLPAPSLVEKCRDHKPYGWSMLYPNRETAPNYKYIQDCPDSGLHYGSPRRGKIFHSDGEGLSPYALASMVWTNEYVKFRKALFGDDPLPGGIRKLPTKKQNCVNYVVFHCPVHKIEQAVCEVLRTREWDTKVIDRPSAESLL